MKKILLPLLLLLSGCALVNAFNTRQYDNVEQDKINYIKTLAGYSKQSCNSSAKMLEVTETLKFKSIELKNFSSSLPNNEESIKLTSLLVEIVTPFHAAYRNNKEPSKMFCELKLSNIEEAASKIQLVTAKRPK